jgi:hypothetical protein
MTITALASEAARQSIPRPDPSLVDNARVATATSDQPTAVEKLVKYIPADLMALYVAVLGAMATVQAVIKDFDAKWAFWITVAATPIVVLIIFAGNRRAKNQPAFPGWRKWPWWAMGSATAAFLIWGCTPPGSAYLTSSEGKALAAFGATVLTFFLTLLEPLLGPRENS